MSFKMHTGDLIPLLGYGTYMIDGYENTLKILDQALAVGYRLFDTAKMYHNESEIGRALKQLLPKHNLQRKDVFITTKLLPSDHGAKAYQAIKESLAKLDCDYIDLYLIHWPGTYGGSSSKQPQTRAESWRQLIKAQKEGLVKNIGVSNYTVILKWSLQQGVGVIPKAASKLHMEENFQLDFTLPEEATKTLSNLKKHAKYDWDPEGVN
ncbi:hypothetical protein YQE_03574, partial [Dendroctonus ponderosae]